MTTIHAKPIVTDKLWLVESEGAKLATLQKFENQFILTGINGSKVIKKRDLIIEFGTDFFKEAKQPIIDIQTEPKHECYGYPTCGIPYHEVFDVKRKIGLFSKADNSNNLYAAGYFFIKFDKKGWIKSFCPRYSTLELYEYKGPWKTEGEIRLREYDDVPY
jgi:hypothetical protein